MSNFLILDLLTKIGLLIVTVILGGMLVGGILFILSLAEWLVIIFALIGGAIAGSILHVAAKAIHIPWRPVIVLATIAMACILYVTLHYAWYLKFRHDTRNDILEETPGLSVYSVNARIDDYMTDEVGTTGFPGYMLLSAKYTVITSTSPLSYDARPDPGKTILTWIAELMAATFGVVAIAWGVTAGYYCKETGRFLDFTRYGMIEGKDVNSFLALLQKGQFEEAARLVEPGYSSSTSGIHLHAAICHENSLEGILRVEVVGSDNKTKDMKTIPLPVSNYQQLIGHLS